ncbi:MAG: bifunctional methylenetetrahydrofolate dehydrogenase/methenyltetrahydrofolate cyclohydrolase [Candidatus Gastranaerophilales bacterium]|nr:bifunctional methylenetetrahydrofolate dehydrogenase/methenyltetrahydrofolate cyclohydrolase [Candidatus Gastranaerophilales bacterium]
MTNIADGKALASKIYEQISSEVDGLSKIPMLVVIITNDNEAGQIYVRNKQRACEKTGILSETIELDANVSEKELIGNILKLNKDELVDAILVQLPLPPHIDTERVLNAISPKKDADGFHYINAGKMFTGQIPNTVACTPKGIIRLLDEYKVKLEGLNAVVIGRSNIVGKPIAQLLLQRNATVTMCHSKTKNIETFTKNADLIVCATGQPEFLKGDMVKDGVIVIDVGISRKDGKLCGDVEFETVAPKASLITPVPGGVGPMTVAMLVQNTLDLTKKHIEDNQKKYITFL